MNTLDHTIVSTAADDSANQALGSAFAMNFDSADLDLGKMDDSMFRLLDGPDQTAIADPMTEEHLKS